MHVCVCVCIHVCVRIYVCVCVVLVSMKEEGRKKAMRGHEEVNIQSRNYMKY